MATRVERDCWNVPCGLGRCMLGHFNACFTVYAVGYCSNSESMLAEMQLQSRTKSWQWSDSFSHEAFSVFILGNKCF